MLSTIRILIVLLVAATASSAAADELTPVKAAVLGVVEGVTEYLPISSTGHLLVTQELLDVGDDGRDRGRGRHVRDHDPSRRDPRRRRAVLRAPPGDGRGTRRARYRRAACPSRARDRVRTRRRRRRRARSDDQGRVCSASDRSSRRGSSAASRSWFVAPRFRQLGDRGHAARTAHAAGRARHRRRADHRAVARHEPQPRDDPRRAVRRPFDGRRARVQLPPRPGHADRGHALRVAEERRRPVRHVRRR